LVPRPIRPDGVDKVTGRAQFGADLNLPNMIYGRVLRSPHAHARIKRIDTSRAKAMPGVFAVVCGADFPQAEHGEIGGEGGGDISDLAKNIMARDKVLYHGHAVAAVAARSQQVAEQALAAIEVEYEAEARCSTCSRPCSRTRRCSMTSSTPRICRRSRTSRATSPRSCNSRAATSPRVSSRPT
jgi:CO/xanthine dehydrogenase Mo-binding subunit